MYMYMYMYIIISHTILVHSHPLLADVKLTLCLIRFMCDNTYMDKIMVVCMHEMCD
jgi:hypothetical protein